MATENKAKILRDAERFVLQGRLTQAIAEYHKIIKNDPKDVLTLNTMGDLCLRLGRTQDANRYFVEVAETYARDNFLLKSIAVYRKILNSDPKNLEINQTLAGLYVRHGLNWDARNQFLRLAEVYHEQGKTPQSFEAYEKVAELDPGNAAVQLRLAEHYLAQEDMQKACGCFAAAGRAQLKAQQPAVALSSFERALSLDPLNAGVMSGLLDACVALKDLAPALNRLEESLAREPDDAALRELLGRAQLAAGAPDKAAESFKALLSADEESYPHMLAASKAFLDLGRLDEAAECLDAIVPILIGRRETVKAVAAYNLILQADPSHTLTLNKLAEIYSATNDQPRRVEILERLVECAISRECPQEGLDYLERILEVNPDSDRCLKLHRDLFAQAYPDIPYRSPLLSGERAREAAGAATPIASQSEGGQPLLVEIDLMLNYGLTDKAMALLQSALARTPGDAGLRSRLFTLLKDSGQNDEAAQQALLLAALHRNGGDEEAAQKHLEEAAVLSPRLAESASDLSGFARRHGIALNPPPHAQAMDSVELDLSGDLSEIFFPSPEGPAPSDGEDAEAHSDLEEFAAPPDRPPSEAPADPFEEVDFYIRLGFHDEARAKLEQIAKQHPNSEEAAIRYREIDALQESADPRASSSADLLPIEAMPSETPEPDIFAGIPNELECPPPATFELPESLSQNEESSAQPEAFPQIIAGAPPAPRPEPAELTDAPERPLNAMFADLFEEETPAVEENSREEFETHFSLGIAYREMNLVDEAINEFETAVRSIDEMRAPKELIQCCGMLSTCFLEKGMAQPALEWCRRGLGVGQISTHESKALRYDMGVAYVAAGDSSRALEYFESIFSRDPGYRDVAQRIDALRGGSGHYDGQDDS
jgi:tetratricopeptide (TPR) repeat protein